MDAETSSAIVAVDDFLIPTYNPSDNSVAVLTDNPSTTDDNEDVVGDITVAAVTIAQSGFLLPIYLGFSYSLEDMVNFPVVLEATYRYDAVAPDGVGAHAFGGGVRYHF